MLDGAAGLNRDDEMAEVETETQADEAEEKGFMAKVKKELREWGVTLAIFIPVYLVFTTFIYELRSIPSESMVPNLAVGDRVAVNKFAYGYSKESVPFGMGKYLPLGDGRLFAREPSRGDVVVFQHPHYPRVMIKRLIGVPGDRIEMRAEKLYLNGEEVATEYLGTRQFRQHSSGRSVRSQEFRETLPGGKSYMVGDFRDTPADDTVQFVVPDGHYFFMGDNRDDSLDSRATSGHCPAVDGVIFKTGCEPRVAAVDASIGFVPFDNLIGRADTVLFTIGFCRDRDDHECPPGRVWKPL
jgi:signal peptidase I